MKKIIGPTIVLLLVFASQAQPVVENEEEVVIWSKINLKDAVASVRVPRNESESKRVNNYCVRQQQRVAIGVNPYSVFD